MKNKYLLPVLIIILASGAVASVVLLSFQISPTVPTEPAMMQNSAYEPEMTYEQNAIMENPSVQQGATVSVDAEQAALEETQKLSDDTSLDTLKNEIDQTNILNEDFSDL